LKKDETAHSDGAPIDSSPERAARSTWGTVAAQTPLIDLTPVDKVTPEEAAAYASFASVYVQDWSEYVDPIAVRLHFSNQGERRLTAHVRVLPVSQNRDLREIIGMVGEARVSVSPVARGVRAVLGVGREADLRREASEAVRTFGRTLKIDWLGEWAMLGMDDRAEVAGVVRQAREMPPLMLGPHERGSSDDLRLLTGLPLYAGVAIAHSGAAAVAITALRHESKGLLQWGDAAEHRKVSVMKACEARSSRGNGPCLYYTLTGSALYVSFSEAQIHRLIDGEIDRTGPASVAESKERGASAAGNQFVFDLAPRRGGGMYMAMTWMLEAALLESADGARDTAEALFRGSPEPLDAERFRALARAVFGAVPVTVDGKLYEARPDGIADPIWGTEHRPSWAPLPVPGSAVQRLLDAVPKLRSAMSFDAEPMGPAVGDRAGTRAQSALSLGLELELSLNPAH
jgi:hypothetical protein